MVMPPTVTQLNYKVIYLIFLSPMFMPHIGTQLN